MTATWLRDRLRERAGRVDPEAYATSLFYVRRDDEHYERCRRNLAGRR